MREGKVGREEGGEEGRECTEHANTDADIKGLTHYQVSLELLKKDRVLLQPPKRLQDKHSGH